MTAVIQRFPRARVGVHLIRQDGVGAAAVSRCGGIADRDGDILQQRQQLLVVPGVTGCQSNRQRSAETVDDQVDLGGLAATGAAQAVVIRLER